MSEVKEWKNSSEGTRVYFVTKGSNNTLLGIFTNRQKLMQALEYSGIDGCIIHGPRKDKEVTDGTIGDEVVFRKRRCDIYRGEEIAYRVGLYYLNNLNPEFIKKALKTAYLNNDNKYMEQELPL